MQKMSIFFVWKEDIYCAVTQSGWIQPLNTTVPGWIMHESSNKAISTHRGRSRSHAERNSVNIQIFAAFLCFVPLFQLQPVLYLAKCMVVFDTVTAHLAFAQFLLKQELPSKQKKKESQWQLVGIRSSSNTTGISLVNTLWTKHHSVNADCHFTGFLGWENCHPSETVKKNEMA